MRSQPYIHRLGRVGSHGVCSGGGADRWIHERSDRHLITNSAHAKGDVAARPPARQIGRYVCMYVCRCCQQQKQYVRLLVIAAAMVLIVVVVWIFHLVAVLIDVVECILTYLHTYTHIEELDGVPYQSIALHVLLVQPIYINHSSLFHIHSFIYLPSHSSLLIHTYILLEQCQRIPPSRIPRKLSLTRHQSDLIHPMLFSPSLSSYCILLRLSSLPLQQRYYSRDSFFSYSGIDYATSSSLSSSGRQAGRHLSEPMLSFSFHLHIVVQSNTLLIFLADLI